MKLKINPLIFLLLIVSSFFVMVYGRHVGGPWVMFEFFMIFNLPSALFEGNFIGFLIIASVVTGQLLFLFLGLRTVKGYKLWLLVLSPLLVTLPVLFYLFSLQEYQRETVISAIPFLSMVLIFYVHCFLKLKKSAKLNASISH